MEVTRWCGTEGSDPLVLVTRWALLGVALGGAPVWPSSGGVGFTEKSVGRRPPCYLPLGKLKGGQNYFEVKVSIFYVRNNSMSAKHASNIN